MSTLRNLPPKRRPAKPVKPAAPPPAPAKSAPAQPKKEEAAAAVADRKAERRRAKKQPARSGGGAAWAVGLGLLMLAFIMALPTVPLVVIGMIPTAVAFFVDRSPSKPAALCVLGLNFAGVAPFIAILWRGPNTLGHSLSMVGDVYTWLIMYGAAALGWLLSMALPPTITAFLKIRSIQRIAALRAQQAKLREEWGIANQPKPPAGP